MKKPVLSYFQQVSLTEAEMKKLRQELKQSGFIEIDKGVFISPEEYKERLTKPQKSSCYNK
jgi:DNA-binding transcriptional regulator PaaX